MAGERQHYIPRLLLKGFSSRTSAHKTFVWYFRKGMDAVEVSIRDIALEKFFYGDSGADSLDSTMTAKESAFAKVVEFIRGEGKIPESDLSTLIDFVHNLVIQTRHTRKGLTEGFNKTANVASTRLSDPSSATQALKKYRERDKEGFRNQLRSEVRKSLGVKDPMIEDSMIHILEENLEKLVPLLGPIFATQVLEKFSSQIHEKGRIAHNDALKRRYQDVESWARLEDYRRLKWNVKKIEPKTLILGDVCVLQMDFQSHEFYPAIAKSKVENGALMLPIAHDTLLIGSSCDDTFLPSTEEININMAEISSEFFVASKNSEQQRLLSNRLNNRAELIDDKIIDELEKEYF